MLCPNPDLAWNKERGLEHFGAHHRVFQIAIRYIDSERIGLISQRGGPASRFGLGPVVVQCNLRSWRTLNLVNSPSLLYTEMNASFSYRDGRVATHFVYFQYCGIESPNVPSPRERLRAIDHLLARSSMHLGPPDQGRSGLLPSPDSHGVGRVFKPGRTNTALSIQLPMSPSGIYLFVKEVLLLPKRLVSCIRPIPQSQDDGEERERLVVGEYPTPQSLRRPSLPPQLEIRSYSPAPDLVDLSLSQRYAQTVRELLSSLPSPCRWLGPGDFKPSGGGPIAAGGFANIWEGIYEGRKVVLKSYRCYRVSFDVSQIIAVRCNR